MNPDKMLNFQPYFAPVDTESAPVGKLTADNIVDELGKDDSPDDDKKSDFDFSLLADDDDDKDSSGDVDVDKDLDDATETDDEPDDDKESEEELKLGEEDEDELELAKIPKRQEIKKAFPDLFKKFPALEHALYREQQYAEIYPSIKDAKESRAALDEFNQFQNDLLGGNIEPVLKSVKATNPKAFDKIATNLLDSLVRTDPNAHLEITRQVSKGVLNYLHTAAGIALKRNPEDKHAEQIQIATELIHNDLFNTREVTPDIRQRVEEENPEQVKLTAERAKFEESRYVAAFNTVSGRVNNKIVNAVTKEIDTKGIFNDYTKNNLVKDVMAECDKQMVSDQRFSGLIKKLWIKAKNDNYSDKSLKDIDTALLNKAQTILQPIMRAKKGEAMKGLSSVRREEGKRELSRNDKEERTTSKEKLTYTKRDSDRNKPLPGESNLDYLMRD
jgi:hypothetical protein